MTRIGRRRHEIDIETMSQSTSAGFPSVSESLFLRTMAFVKSRPGKEKFDDDQVVATTETVFNIYWAEGVTDLMRVKWNDGYSTRYFRIVDVINLYEENRELDIVTVEFPAKERAK